MKEDSLLPSVEFSQQYACTCNIVILQYSSGLSGEHHKDELYSIPVLTECSVIYLIISYSKYC